MVRNLISKHSLTPIGWMRHGKELQSPVRAEVLCQTLADIASQQNVHTGKLTVAFGRLVTELLEYSGTEGYGKLISMMREMIE